MIVKEIQQQQFQFSSQRCVYWENEKSIIVSDLHLGKTGHFRKEGINVPQNIYKEDLHHLFTAIQNFKVTQIIIVGDMFHSVANKELNLFSKWRKDFSHIKFVLVKGNHDILEDSWYQENKITVYKNELTINNISFCHEGTLNDKEFTFTGHIHPGVKIRGMGKQSLSLPCFYVTANHCILPAFGRFTGLKIMEPKKNNEIYAIANQSIFKLNDD
jgi:uncharacterized protein